MFSSKLTISNKKVFPLIGERLLIYIQDTDYSNLLVKFSDSRVQQLTCISLPKFELDTLEPLISLGYYKGSITPKLSNNRADAYDSPDDQGSNQEFWLEMTLKAEPSVRFLVVDSDNAPLSGGTYLDGIYVYLNGVLTPIDEIR